jgi:hypothetical protein
VGSYRTGPWVRLEEGGRLEIREGECIGDTCTSWIDLIVIEISFSIGIRLPLRMKPWIPLL